MRVCCWMNCVCRDFGRRHCYVFIQILYVIVVDISVKNVHCWNMRNYYLMHYTSSVNWNVRVVVSSVFYSCFYELDQNFTNTALSLFIFIIYIESKMLRTICWLTSAYHGCLPVVMIRRFQLHMIYNPRYTLGIFSHFWINCDSNTVPTSRAVTHMYRCIFDTYNASELWAWSRDLIYSKNQSLESHCSLQL